MKKYSLIPPVFAIGSSGFSMFLQAADFKLYSAPSILLSIILIPLFIVLMSYSFADIINSFAIAFKKEAMKTDLINAKNVLASLSNPVLVTGILLMLIGIVYMFFRMPEEFDILQGVEISILSLIYALAVNLLIIMPFSNGIVKRIDDTN